MPYKCSIVPQAFFNTFEAFPYYHQLHHGKLCTYNNGIVLILFYLETVTVFYLNNGLFLVSVTINKHIINCITSKLVPIVSTRGGHSNPSSRTT